MFLMVLFILTACGNELQNVKQINLSYWEVTEERQDTLIQITMKIVIILLYMRLIMQKKKKKRK